MEEPRKSRLPIPLGSALEANLPPARVERLWAKVRARRGAHLGGYSEPPRAGMYLPAPVARALDEADDLANKRSRLWRQIQARRRPTRTSSPWRGAFALSFVVAAAAFLMVVVRPHLASRGRELSAVRATSMQDVLREPDGAALSAHEAGATNELIRLSDRSEIRLAPGARIEPVVSSATRLELVLTRGEAEFSVTPGGPRRWVVQAGLASVEVLGTVFRVARDEQGVRVSVSRGVVLVRAASVPGGARRLLAGETLAVEREHPASAAAAVLVPLSGHESVPDKGAAKPAGEVKEDAPATRRPHRRRQRQEPWKAHVKAGRFVEAYQVLGAAGFSREVGQAESVESLLSLADAARLSGHARDAVAPLKRVLSDFASHPQAALAAFTLGRVLLDQLASPAAAAQAFERAITMHPPHALLGDCHARLVEAHTRAGNRAAAERAAARYRTLFPAGRHDVSLGTWKNRR